MLYNSKLKTIFLYFFCACFVFGCEDVFFDSGLSNTPEQNFTSLWTTFNEKYAPFEQRNVDWDQVFETIKPRVNKNTRDDELYRIFIEMLGELDDAHVTLTAPNRPVWNANKIFRLKINDAFFDLALIRQKYLSKVTVSGPFTTGSITLEQGIIGYIYIQHFENIEADFWDDALAMLDQTIIGIIIDLRHNSGGDFRNGLLVASRFADQKRLAFTTKAKSGPGRNEFASPVKWYVEPAGELQFRDQPVIILTDRYTVSAAERTVMAFDVLPNVTIIGDTTSGAHGEKIGQELPNGWFFSLTPQIVFAADGLSYEGKGISPDLYVNPKPQFPNFDPILGNALVFLTFDPGTD